MEVLILTIFVSSVLVLVALWAFAWSVRQRSHEHSDRLTLLPLQDDEVQDGPQAPAQAANQERKSS